MNALPGFTPSYERALVTGGGSGIGRAVALSLGQAGVDVTIMGRRAEALEEAAKLGVGAPGRIQAVPGDIREPEQVDAAFAAAEADGPVQMLFHAAAGAFLSFAEDITPNGFRSVVDSGLVGVFVVVHRWARPLIDAGLPGVAVNVTSALASREVAGAAHSCAAKAGAEALTRTLAYEWARYGLRLNALAPGIFHTEGSDANMWSQSGVAERIQRSTPIGRFGAPEEILGPALFLLSKAASYVTGDVLVVDGGLRLSGWRMIAPDGA